MSKYEKVLDFVSSAVRRATLNHLIETGSYLVSERGENPEYDRGIYELIADAMGTALPESAGDDMDSRREYVQDQIDLVLAQRKVNR